MSSDLSRTVLEGTSVKHHRAEAAWRRGEPSIWSRIPALSLAPVALTALIAASQPPLDAGAAGDRLALAEASSSAGHASSNRASSTGAFSSSSTEVASRLNRAERDVQEGRTAEAASLYREILLTLDPLNETAYDALMTLQPRLTLPASNETESLVHSRLGGGFRRHVTDHFILLSDGDPTWTQEQAARLERAHHEFFRFANRLNLRPLPLDQRLVCVLFDSAQSFSRFAAVQDNVNERWVAGYYAAKPNYVVFYNTMNGPALEDARDHLAQAERDLTDVREQIKSARLNRDEGRAQSLMQEAASMSAYVDREKRRLTDIAGGLSTAKTIHEAIHQLAFNTGVQSRYRHYPFWATEGLATAFETDRAGESFGPDRVYSARQQRFDRLLDEGRLLSLKDLVRLDRVPDGSEETAEVMYHESYAFCRWVYRFRRDELADYLKRMALPVGYAAAPSGGRVSPEEHLRIFEDCFGDVDALEREWLKWERSN